jgi:WD40 repeat protein
MVSSRLDIVTREIYTCVFAAEGMRAITGAQGNPVQLWDLETGKCLRTFVHTGPVWALAWNPDRRSFLSVDGTMRLWDVETGRCVQVFEGHTAGVVSAAFSSDQRRAFSCDWGGGIRVWDLTD